MIRFKSKIIFTASLLILISCNSHSRRDLGRFQRWKAKKYTFLYPEEWKLDTTGKFGAPLIINSPKESPNDKFSESIVLTITLIPDSLSDINKRGELDKRQLSKLGNILVFEKEILSDSTIFYHVEYEKIANGFLTIGIQGMWLRKHEAYLLICVSEKDRFEKYREIFNKVLNSFTLIN